MPASHNQKISSLCIIAKNKRYKVTTNIGQPDIETPKTALDALKNIEFKSS